MPGAERGIPSIVVHKPSIGPEEIAAVVEVCAAGWLGMGEVTDTFEQRLREIVGVRHAVGVQSGTAALHLALEAVGAGPGDEVIVPSFTFAASVQAILMAGARPVFCEVDLDTLGIDVEDALGRVTPSTKAILPVDYGGVACDYDRLLAETRPRGIAVVADAAHSFGSTYQGRAVGTLADVTCFSFDATKSVTCGDGGAVVTDDDEVARHCLATRNLGIAQSPWTRMLSRRPWSYDVTGPGYRYRLGNLNAAIGLVQLDRLDEFRARKREIVERYDSALADCPGIAFPNRRGDETLHFLYVIRVLDGRRDDLLDHLAERSVQGWVHFTPNHLQPAFAEYRVPLPETERVFGEVVTLPLHMQLTDDDVERVVEGVRSFLLSTVPA